MSYLNFIGCQPDFNEKSYIEPVAGRLVVRYTSAEFCRLVQYGVLVEAWELKGRVKRLRREYAAAFTKAERALVSRWTGRFYEWYFTTGTPVEVAASVASVALLVRVIDFFARAPGGKSKN